MDNRVEYIITRITIAAATRYTVLLVLLWTIAMIKEKGDCFCLCLCCCFFSSDVLFGKPRCYGYVEACTAKSYKCWLVVLTYINVCVELPKFDIRVLRPISVEVS